MNYKSKKNKHGKNILGNLSKKEYPSFWSHLLLWCFLHLVIPITTSHLVLSFMEAPQSLDLAHHLSYFPLVLILWPKHPCEPLIWHSGLSGLLSSDLSFISHQPPLDLAFGRYTTFKIVRQISHYGKPPFTSAHLITYRKSLHLLCGKCLWPQWNLYHFLIFPFCLWSLFLLDLIWLHSKQSTKKCYD